MKAKVIGKLCTEIAILASVGLWTATEALADPRLWGPMGVPVRTASNWLWNHSVVQDSAGNTLYTWVDERAGDPDIYAQLVSPAGVPLWASDGAVVLQHSGDQRYPVACATNGGWVIAWIDYRFGWHTNEDGDVVEGDIYAQKLDYSGHRVWDWGDGDGRVVDMDPTAVEPGLLRVMSDDSGGAFFAWERFQEWDQAHSLLVQRVLASGSWAWNSPLTLGTGLQTQICLAASPGGHGSILLSWLNIHDGSHYPDLRLAKIMASGEMPWGDQGMTIRDTVDFYTAMNVCSDGHDGAYLGLTLPPLGGSGENADIWAQRISHDGQFLWGPGGVSVCDAPGSQGIFTFAASMNGDTTDGAILIWQEGNSYVYAQKILPSGQAAWAANGILVSIHGDYWPSGTSDGAGGLIATWTDRRTYRDVMAWATRVNAAGQHVWDANGVCIGDTSAYQQSYAIPVVHGSECNVGFEQFTDTLRSLRIQKLDLATGNRLFDPAGNSIHSGLDGNVQSACSVPMAEGRVAVLWSDTDPNIHYQIVDSTGHTYLTPNGALLTPSCDLPDGGCSQINLCACPDGSGGFFATFEDASANVRAVHVNAAGEVASDPAGVVVGSVQYNSSPTRQSYCASDGLGGCFVVYAYFIQYVGLDLRATRIDGQCQPLWTAPVVLGALSSPRIKDTITDSTGSCVVAWTGVPQAQPSGLILTRLMATREVRWSATVSTASRTDEGAALCADGAGGLFAAYHGAVTRDREDSLLVQHYDGQGNSLWSQGGVLVSQDSLSKTVPDLSLNSAGELLAVWSGAGIYGQKFSTTGRRLWGDCGTPLCSELPGQSNPQIVPDASGGFLAMWKDSRSTYPAAFGNYFDRDARPVSDPYWGGWRGAPVTDTCNTDEVAAAFPMWGNALMVHTHGGSLYVQYLRLNPAAAAGDNPSASVPSRFALSQNYPNPFNPTTQISFALPKAGTTTLKVYDLLGRAVTTLVNRTMPAGNHTASFDASALASGVYFYRLESGTFSATKKLVLLK